MKIYKLILNFRKPNIKKLHKDCYYFCDNMVFQVSKNCVYNKSKGSSIPYLWLVDMKTEKCYFDSTLGLPKKRIIHYAKKNDVLKAKEIISKKTVSFDNIRYLIRQSKLKLDEAMKMLNKLENGEKR